MITDRGANLRLAPSDAPSGLLDGVALLHLTGYTLVDPGPRPVALDLIAQARRRGVPVSVDPGSAAFLAGLAPGEFLRWTAGAAVCFPNRDEATVLAGGTDPARMASSLCAHYGVVAVKLAADGAVLATREALETAPRRFPAHPAVVRDTTGAGDAFCAGFLAAWLAGAGLAGAMSSAARAAAVAVTILGGRPDAGPRQATDVPRSVQG